MCQLTLLTRLRRALGLSRAYQALTAGWLPVWALLPLLRPLLEAVEVPGPDGLYPKQRGWALSIAVNVFLSLATVVTMNSSLLMVIVNDSAPDRTALGGVNGISTAVGCMARVVGPSLVSAVSRGATSPCFAPTEIRRRRGALTSFRGGPVMAPRMCGLRRSWPQFRR